MVGEITARGTAALSASFLAALRNAPYDFFTDRSGLSDGHSAMLVTEVERSVRRIRHIQEWGVRRTLRSSGHGSHRLSNDLLPRLRLPRFRPSAMDARHEAQGGNSSRGGQQIG